MDLPKFKGKLFVPPDYDLPEVDFLKEDFGREVNKEVQVKYKEFHVINKVRYSDSDNYLKGSTPFYVVAVNEFIRSEGLRTATPSDLEAILRTKVLNLRGFYEDSALVLRSVNGQNQYLSIKLFEDIKLRHPQLNLPIVILLNGLDLVKDQDSLYGLREDATLIYAPILNEEKGNFSAEDIDEKTGLPKNLKGGNRILYTIKEGLARLRLCRALGLRSWDVGLDGSDGEGRVIIVTGEINQRIFWFNSRLESYLNFK